MNLINREEFSDCLTEAQKGAAARQIIQIQKNVRLEFIVFSIGVIILYGFMIFLIIDVYPHFTEVIESNFDPNDSFSLRDLDGVPGVFQDLFIFIAGIPIFLWQAVRSVRRFYKNYHKWDVYYVDKGTVISAVKLMKKSNYQLTCSLPCHNEPVLIKCSEQEYLSAKKENGLVIIEFPYVTDKRCLRFRGVFTSDNK